MSGFILDATIRVSNALVDIAWWLDGRGHSGGKDRVIALRGRVDRAACKFLLGHPRIVYGSMCDICLDCLTVVDEHPNGRGRVDQETTP